MLPIMPENSPRFPPQSSPRAPYHGGAFVGRQESSERGSSILGSDVETGFSAGAVQVGNGEGGGSGGMGCERIREGSFAELRGESDRSPVGQDRSPSDGRVGGDERAKSSEAGRSVLDVREGHAVGDTGAVCSVFDLGSFEPHDGSGREAFQLAKSYYLGTDRSVDAGSEGEGSNREMEDKSYKEFAFGSFDRDVEMGCTVSQGKGVNDVPINDDGDKVCRVCHLGLSAEGNDSMELGCACKQELALAHRHCAEAWFKIRGNRVCEICGAIVENLPVMEQERASESQAHTEGGVASFEGERRARSFPVAQLGYCWQRQFVRNSLLACLIVVFIVPWFFRIAYFTA